MEPGKFIMETTNETGEGIRWEGIRWIVNGNPVKYSYSFFFQAEILFGHTEAISELIQATAYRNLNNHI